MDPKFGRIEVMRHDIDPHLTLFMLCRLPVQWLDIVFLLRRYEYKRRYEGLLVQPAYGMGNKFT